MQTIDLGGTWQASSDDQKTKVAAVVPGCIHTDLLRAKKLPDLFWRDNELQHDWVYHRDWTFAREFTVSAADLAANRLVLRCDGLDTLATVTVNGQVVIEADNMFRGWEADVSALVKTGKNRISVTCRSPLPTLAAGQQRRHLPAWNCYRPEFAGKSYVRKMACAFGWDWGPVAPTAGIWKPIRLIAIRTGRFADVRLQQNHTPARCDVIVTARVERVAAGPLRVRATIRRDSVTVSGEAQVSEDGGVRIVLPVRDPELWWPNGMGAQPLYDVAVELIGDGGVELDAWRKRTGLRTLQLVQADDQWGRSFKFAVNGVDVFAKGANWVPLDIFPTECDRPRYEKLLTAARDCHMNVIRLWGGGFYEHDAFYELCDELGLMIWHDFMYACSTYPLHEPQFLANCGAEAAEHIRRVRHHPSIALWCGNNELEQGLVGPKWDNWQMSWEDYGKLFDDLLPRLVAELDGERAYWPCSPHTPMGERKDFNNPNSGDAHCWDVWFGWKPFEAQRTWQHRFMSEFGFQSFPEPRTVAAFIADTPEDRNLTSYVMDFHQRSKQQGNRCIYAYLLDWFRQPKDFEHGLWMTQLTHALCIQVAAEHTRRMQPRMMGVVYWQLNDLWPAPTWASIDVFGRWKALQYLARRFFAPVLVLGIDDPAKGTIAIHLSNHLPTAERLTVAWRLTDTSGKVLAKGAQPVEIAAQSAQEIATVARADLKKPPAAESLLLWLEARRGNDVVSENLCFFARPKHLTQNTKPKVKAAVAAQLDGTFRITLSAAAPALWTRLELVDADADWSDNWLHLDGARAHVVTAKPWRKMTLAQFRKQLRVSSLVDHG